ncbi:MAG: 4Fe-4S dicluster domain-containing protein [Betaproteobacteria bacterium]
MGSRPDHFSCSGCDLCLLACPVWRQKRDIRLTPHGRAKALQHGATVADLGASIAGCTLCGSCEPACPEDIPLVDLILDLRRRNPIAAVPLAPATSVASSRSALLLPDPGLRSDAGRLQRVAGLLGAGIATDDGTDIALALEAGAAIPPARLAGFIKGVDGAPRVIVADGLLQRRLREWLPGLRVEGLGEALSNLPAVRSKLRPRDLYVIEARAFHHDHARLIGHYDDLRATLGLEMNLDLQRLAIATTASSAQRRLGLPSLDAEDQARWILGGRDFERVVVEDANDCAVFAAVTDRAVLHLGDL